MIRPRLDLKEIPREQLIELYQRIAHGPANGVVYNDVLVQLDGQYTTERAVVLECARRFVELKAAP